MYPKLPYIKSVLIHESYITEEDSLTAEEHADSSESYIAYLIDNRLLTKSLLGQALAESYRLPYADLQQVPPQPAYVEKLPEDFARSNRALVLQEGHRSISIATDAPEDFDLKALQKLFKHKEVQLAYTLPESIDAALRLYEKPLVTKFSQIIESGKRLAPEIVDVIISDALNLRASDIHFEPHAEEVHIRFRVDGALRQTGTLPKQYYENILNRIKVEGGMRIDEHFSAQDGAIQRQYEDTQVTIRISLVPTVHGEKIAMRVLGSYAQSYSLLEIGMNEAQQKTLEEYARKPFGMILTVGPTGSGKTTTLYSLVKLLNDPNVNITSIEDPVEYRIDGINQIQVREQSNLTFAKGLRSIVRQDPDVILVGEIRDKETAEISVNAALTGHLLLSTFHANNAAAAIPRLIDMGIEPFLLSSTLEVIIAQRLVRKLCPSCRYGTPVTKMKDDIPAGIARYFKGTKFIYRTKGCAACSNTGYVGRTALYEFIDISPAIQDLIVANKSALDIQKQARKQGNITMFEDGIAKVASGLTSIEEVLRVVEIPEV